MHDLQTIIAMNAEKTVKADVQPNYTDAKEAMTEENAVKARSYDFAGSSDLRTARVHNHNFSPKPKADVSHWMLTGRSDWMVLHGQVWNDELRRFNNGEIIRTSKIVRIDLINMQVETLNTIYTLINPPTQ